jgi:ADP-ribose pyrophosphatase YjhB (NUDIX family)
VLLDANMRVLLFRHADGYGREFWATPGGGLEAGETAAQAARREAAEELGATDADLVELWTGHSEFDFANRRVSQTETFFLVKLNSEILGPEVRELHQLERIIEARWWSLDEVDATRDPVFPVDLVARVREHATGAG